MEYEADEDERREAQSGRSIERPLILSMSYDTSKLSFGSFTAATGWDNDSGWLGAGQFGGSSFPGMANQRQATLQLGTLHFDALQGGQAQVPETPPQTLT